jgi:enamine deaminase RidA (YjgF/YER057c/UK114 family)
MPAVTFHDHPDGAEMASANGYSQCSKLPSGAVVLSGILGVDANMNLPSTLREQVTLLLENIAAALAEGGAKLQDVYKIVSYHRELRTSGDFIEGWKRLVGTKPTWTAVGVRELGIESAAMEVQVEAWVDRT